MCSSIKKDKGELLYFNVMSVCERVRTCSSTHPRTEMLLY
jgi:hypothetical protein